MSIKVYAANVRNMVVGGEVFKAAVEKHNHGASVFANPDFEPAGK